MGVKLWNKKIITNEGIYHINMKKKKKKIYTKPQKGTIFRRKY